MNIKTSDIPKLQKIMDSQVIYYELDKNNISKTVCPHNTQGEYGYLRVGSRGCKDCQHFIAKNDDYIICSKS